MGKNKAKSKENSSLRGRNHNIALNSFNDTRFRASKRAAGVDLAFKGYTAIAVSEKLESLTIAWSRNTWLSLSLLYQAKVVAVDAPLAGPKPSSLREVEKNIRRVYHTPLLPCSFPGMRRLCKIGFSLRLLLEEAGKLIVETYPAATARKCNLSRSRKRPLRDIEDALISLAAAIDFVEGTADVLFAEDGFIVIPSCNTAREVLEYYRKSQLHEGKIKNAT